MESKNPYAPPKAVVEDVSSAAEPPRPPQVAQAVKLLWAGVVIGFLSGFVNLMTTDTPEMPMPRSAQLIAIAISWSIALLVLWWILSSIGKGKNWARIVQLILFLGGLLGLTATFAVPHQVSGFVWSAAALQTGINIWGLILLFSGPSNAWFREMKEWL